MRRTPWWTIGWRNLGRNRRRTILTASGLALGYFSVVIMVGLSEGMTAQMIDNGTGLVTGQLQVHSTDYLPERSVYETIGGDEGTDVALLLETIESDPAVQAAAPRVFGGGLLSSGARTSASVLVGVDPQREARVARIMSAMVAGQPPRSGESEVLVGSEMARRLEVGPGDEVVLVAPAADGSLGNDLFTVSGIFESGLAELDGSYTLLPIDVLQFLLVLPESRVHEVAARIDDPWLAPEAAERLQVRIETDGLPVDVQAWTTYRPEMVDYARLAEASYWIVIVIVFGMAIFGVANTMLMAAFERRREFALVLAVGASPWGIVRSVLSEAVALGTVALVGGLFITVPVLVWWHNAPLDLSGLIGGFTMAGGFVRPVLRVEYPYAVLLQSAVALWLTALAAATLPAVRASHVPPADTMAGR